MENESYINTRLKKISEQMNIYEPNASLLQKIWIIFDLIVSIIVDGATIDEYFQYYFRFKRFSERRKFFIGRKRKKLVKILNNEDYREYLDNKIKFNKKFNHFISRDWLYLQEHTERDFESFINKHKEIFVKPVKGRYGLGTRIIRRDEIDNIQEFYQSLKNEDVLLEEVIKQHEIIKEFNPSSVNTIRVVTLLTASNSPKIVTATFRCGNGDKCADNFHHGGIAALIDINTGIVKTTGIDRNKNRYIVHPVTNKQIIGFRVPNWEKIKEKVAQAAKVIPEIRYIGWDVAIKDNGEIAIIEGNFAADPDVSQMPDQIGKWDLYKQDYKEIRAMYKNKLK